MKLKNFKEDYYIFSSKLSDSARKLAFAGIGAVWIFRQGENEASVLPGMLKLALLMFVITLFLDILQYVYQTTVWGVFHRYYEKKLNEDDELTAPRCLNWPALLFFMFKVIVLVVGYVFVIKFLL